MGYSGWEDYYGGLLRIYSERYNFLESEEDKDTVVRLVGDICNMRYGVSEA